MRAALIFATIIAIIVGILDISVPEEIKPRAVPVIGVSFILAFILQRFIPTTFKSFITPIIAFITVFLSTLLLG